LADDIAPQNREKDSMSLGDGHILIGGTGRSGTTLLVQILTHLNFDTGFSKDQALERVDGISKAGLETRLDHDDLPHVIKSPWLSDDIDEALEGGLKVEAVVIPFRGLFEAAESRRHVYRQAEARGKDPLAHPGSIWKTTDPSEQEGALALELYRLLDPLVARGIPFVFLGFPRFVQDGEYFYRQLKAIFDRHGVGREEVLKVHGRIADPNLVSKFRAPQSGPTPSPSPPPPVPARPAPALEPSRLGAFLSAASFWEPRYSIDSAWLEHAPFAFWLVNTARPRSLVELGAHKGFSYFAFCQAVKASKIACRCHAVDTWRGDDQAGFYGEEVYEAVRGHNDEHYAEFSRLLRMTFDEALAQFPDGSVDLLHIDGFHSYEQVKHDFDTWRPKLTDRAVVLLHDIHVRRDGFGVFRLWEELSERYPHFEFVHGNGLGVIGVGADAPAGLKALFAASPDSRLALEIRSAYQSLGAAVAAELDTERLRENIEDLQTQVEALTRKFAMRDAEFIEVTTSTAWRITRPLRALAGRLKKLSGKTGSRD